MLILSTASVRLHAAVSAILLALCRATEELQRTSTAKSFLCDVRSKQQVDQLVSDVVAKFGGLDILVANAGIFKTSEFMDMTEEDFDTVIQTNLKGAFLVSPRFLSACLFVPWVASMSVVYSDMMQHTFRLACYHVCIYRHPTMLSDLLVTLISISHHPYAVRASYCTANGPAK